MYFLAVSALEKVGDVSPDTWLKIALGVVILVMIVMVVRRAAQANKVVVGVCAFVGISILFFSWVYNRNEPKFLTPLISKIAPFFPTAKAQASRQAQPRS